MVVIESIAVIRAITDEMLRLGLQHGEVETELDPRDFMMIGRMRTHGERESLSIHNREDLHAFPTLRESDRLAATLRRGTCRINDTLPRVDGPFVAQRIRQLREDLTQHLALAPLLEPTRNGFVIRIARRQEVPLRTRVQNPEHGFQHARVGIGLRPGRPSGMCSSGKCSRMRSHWSSRRRRMIGLIGKDVRAVNYFEIGSSLRCCNPCATV